MVKKIIVIECCTECSHVEWIAGKPRCQHPEIKTLIPCEDNYYCIWPRVYTDGTKPFLDDCPLKDYEEKKVVCPECGLDAVKYTDDGVDNCYRCYKCGVQFWV